MRDGDKEGRQVSEKFAATCLFHLNHNGTRLTTRDQNLQGKIVPTYLLGEKGTDRVYLAMDARRQCRHKQRLKYDWADNAGLIWWEGAGAL